MNLNPKDVCELQHNVAVRLPHGIMIQSKAGDEYAVITVPEPDPMRVAVLKALRAW